MVKETVVNQNLTQEMTDAGANLLRQLDKLELTVKAAFWFFLPETDNWRLIFAFPEVKNKGPALFYEKIQDAIKECKGDIVPLQNITVKDYNDNIIQLLRKAIKTSPDATGNRIRFSRSAINGVFIEDALIYRLA